MTGQTNRGGGGLPDDLPIGRRVAYWRGLRRMSQQVFADRLGKSKSWVDKVERGVRRLNKVSVLRDVADVLRVSVSQLTGNHLTGGQWCRADNRADQRADSRAAGRDWRPGVLLGQTYQITAEVLRRLGEHDLAWLAADRAMAAGADSGEPWWAARAAIPLSNVVRDTGRPRHAFEVCVTTAHKLAGPDPLDTTPEQLSIHGTLLLHAALSAATSGDRRSTTELLHQAHAAAQAVGPGRDHYRTHFGPAPTTVTTLATAVALGHGDQMITHLPEAATDPDHQRLPTAIRAAYLIDVARAHLQAGNPHAAGRAIVTADQTAPAEVRHRPATHEVLGAVLRGCGQQPEPPVAHLAETIGITV